MNIRKSGIVYCDHCEKPINEAERIQISTFNFHKACYDTPNPNPQPSEDTDEPSVDWIIKELSLSSPLAQFNAQRLREIIAAHDRNLLAGIVEKLDDALKIARWGDYQRADGSWGYGIANKDEIKAIIKAAMGGGEKR